MTKIKEKEDFLQEALEATTFLNDDDAINSNYIVYKTFEAGFNAGWHSRDEHISRLEMLLNFHNLQKQMKSQ